MQLENVIIYIYLQKLHISYQDHIDINKVMFMHINLLQHLLLMLVYIKVKMITQLIPEIIQLVILHITIEAQFKTIGFHLVDSCGEL